MIFPFAFIVLVWCALDAIFVRRPKKQPLWVPAVIAALAFLAPTVTAFRFTRVFEAVSHVNPEDKATILAAGISELMTGTILDAVILGALAFAIWFAERTHRQRRAPRATSGATPS